MRILILEDNDSKYAVVRSEIEGFFRDKALEMRRAKTLVEGLKNIFEERFSLIVLDLMMPTRTGEAPSDITQEVLQSIESSECNRGSAVIALTGFEDLARDQKAMFAHAGIVLVHYEGAEIGWRSGVRSALSRVSGEMVYDFVVICALEKERAAFRNTSASVKELRNLRGLDCLSMSVGTYQGLCVKLPRMGLVEASIITSRVLERFRPALLAMSGICAGISDEARIGALVVADVCWEYQAGKWSDSGFQVEHYDIALTQDVRTALSQMVEVDPKAQSIKHGLLEDQVVFEPVLFGPMVTGSAVIASKDRLSSITLQHRKLAALDMEMYGVYKAAYMSETTPMFFGAKTVVDVGDGAKNDRYHTYGCDLSARFVVKGIQLLLGGRKDR